MKEFLIPSPSSEGEPVVWVEDVDVASLSQGRRIQILDDISVAICEENASNIIDGIHFDALSALVRFFPEADVNLKRRIVGALVGGGRLMARELSRFLSVNSEGDLMGTEEIAERRLRMRSSLKMHAFLLHGLAVETDRLARDSSEPSRAKKTKKDSLSVFSWEEPIEQIVASLGGLLEEDIARLWPGMSVDEEFSGLFNHLVFLFLEHPTITKNRGMLEALSRLFSVALNKFPNGAVSAANILNDLLHKFEHTPVAIAEFFAFAARDGFARTDVVLVELLQDIGNTSSNEYSRGGSAGTTSTKSVASFLAEIAVVSPRTVLSQMSVILRHLNGESYLMRNGIMQAMANLLRLQGEQSPFVAVEDDHSHGATQKTKKELISILLNHIRDVNAYTRSRTLQIWAQLAETQSIPLHVHAELVSSAVGRLSDRSSIVRRNAVALLSALVRFNPFSIELRRSMFEELFQRNEKQTEEIIKATVLTIKEMKEAELDVMDTSRDITQEDIDAGDTLERSMVVEDKPGRPALSDEEREKLKRSEEDFKKYRNALHFLDRIQDAMPILSSLVTSPTITEAIETIRFFVVARQFRIDEAKPGIRKMLHGLFSTEPSVRQAVLDAYVLLYLSPDCLPAEMRERHAPGLDNDSPEVQTLLREESVYYASNLVGLVDGAEQQEDLVCLEELYTQMMIHSPEPLVPPQVVAVLWDMFLGKLAHFPPSRRLGALHALTMLGNGKPAVVLARLESVREILADPESSQELCIQACRAVTKVGAIAAVRDATPLRVSSRNALCLALESVALKSCELTEEAVNAIYAVSQAPEENASRIVHRAVAPLQTESPTVSSRSLGLLLSLAGQIAVQQLIHQDVLQSVMRRQKQKDASSSSTETKANAGTAENKGSEKEEANELEIVSGSQEATQELIREAVEREIIALPSTGVFRSALESVQASYIPAFPTVSVPMGESAPQLNLLGACAPLVVKIASDTGDTYDSTLRATAVLALCKFCVASEPFCRANLQLLFTLGSTSREVRIRERIVATLGDLLCRFPNLVEPWTPHVYARLGDPDLDVRTCALLVLSHLVLNDMIKVKGQISEIARCVVDENEKMSLLARAFFIELATKGNKLYNVLTDILGNLSTAQDVTPDEFRSIMRFLFDFLEKAGARQIDSMVEKLCSRFSASEDPKAWRDVAFCLSMLSFSDRGLKKLLDSSKFYTSRLTDDDVYESFRQILKKSHSARTDSKAVLEELEKVVERARSGPGDVAEEDEKKEDVDMNEDSESAVMIEVEDGMSRLAV